MTHAQATTFRFPWLRHGTSRRETAPANPAQPHAIVLPPRQRRALGAALTAAGAGTVVTSAAELAAQPTPASAAQVLLVAAATVTLAHCTATAGDGDGGL